MNSRISASPPFDRLRREHSDFIEHARNKIVLIEGDLDRDGFGLGEVRADQSLSSVSDICAQRLGP